MNERKISETVHILLHDPSFIMWCLSPTEELDLQWLDWLEKHPDKQQELEDARSILKSVRINDLSIPLDKSKLLWERLQLDMQQKQARRRILVLRYAAACIIVLLLSVASLRIFNESRLSDSNSLANTNISIDSTHTEVTLIIDNNEKVKVEDNAFIAYDSNITVKGKDKTVIKKIKDCVAEKSVMNTLIVPKGRRSSLSLPDGSKVWVNSGSVLRFPSRFESDHRTVDVEGEIYIEVVKNETPFFVKTKGFTVNVLGTKFNISAYADEEECSVVLVEGKVLVKTYQNENIQLSPDRKLTMVAGRNRIDKVDVYDYISWKDGLLQFKGETMENILMRLSRYYNIPIKCKPEIGHRRSSGKLVLFDDIDQVLETFSMLYGIRYRFEADTLLIEY